MTKFLISFSFIFLFSCARWTDANDQEFLKQCDRNKFDKEYCNCALEKVKSSFSSYKQMIKQEKKTAELFVECLED